MFSDSIVNVYLEFQFQYGTIKSLVSSTECTPVACFNSSMVRLKDRVKLLREELPLFQFQYGTIKSQIADAVTTESYVSIPVWYD